MGIGHAEMNDGLLVCQEHQRRKQGSSGTKNIFPQRIHAESASQAQEDIEKTRSQNVP